jgi:hypothetical protein
LMLLWKLVYLLIWDLLSLLYVFLPCNCILLHINCICWITLFQVFCFYTHFLSREGDTKQLGLCFDDLVMMMTWIWHLNIYSPCMYLCFPDWFQLSSIFKFYLVHR